MHIIVLQIEGDKSHQAEIPCVIGRGEDAGLRIMDDTISHRHALIFPKGEEVLIEDLGSRNGVFVNDRRVVGKMPLHPGDCIQLGRVQMKYVESEVKEFGETVILHASNADTELELDRQRLRWIHEMTIELSEHMDSPMLGDRIMARLKQVFRCDQFYLGMFQEDGSLRSMFPGFTMEEAPVSRTIVNRLLQNGESFILADALTDEPASPTASFVALKIRSAICAPLAYRSNIYGLIYLASDIPGVYSQMDLEFLKTIASLLGPKVENARLWAEIRGLYDKTVENLKKTHARLMSMERARAYVWLAQAMAHEIRNPVMVIGAMATRIARQETGEVNKAHSQAIVNSAERIELVLKEVDNFASLPEPCKKPERIDLLLQEEADLHRDLLAGKNIVPIISIDTARLTVPLDGDLFRKALSLLFREILPNVPSDSDLLISVQDRGNNIEIGIGPAGVQSGALAALDEDHGVKPSASGLFLNLAHKIIYEQGGEVLLDPGRQSPFPMIIRIPRISEVIASINLDG